MLAVATRPGQYDFLHVSGALGKWLPTDAPTLDPAAPFFPDGVAPPPAAPPTAPMNTGLNAPAAPTAAPVAAAAAAPNGACAPAAPPEMAQPPTE